MKVNDLFCLASYPCPAEKCVAVLTKAENKEKHTPYLSTLSLAFFRAAGVNATNATMYSKH